MTLFGLLVAQNIAFWVLAVLMTFAALRLVTTRNVVHAALYLVAVLAGVAALFILMGAEFVGITQILIYIGAVIILFLFGIMLTRTRIGKEEKTDHRNRLGAILAGLALAGVTIYTVISAFGAVELGPDTRTTTAQVSDSIFSQYIIPFEAVSVLLLAALIGAIVVARRE